MGCVVSLLESGALDPARVALSSLTWTWAPLLQIASLAVVWKAAPRPTPFRLAVDRFFAGNTCWWLFLLAFAVGHSAASETVWLAIAAAIALWSAFIDYRFFRGTLASSSPLRDLLLQKAAAWIPGILFFGGASLVPGLIERLK